jgi:hypothetical protein
MEREAEIRALIDAQRARCLWFLEKDYYPATLEETLRVLRHIERNGDLDAFKRAGQLRQWLSPTTNAASVGS